METEIFKSISITGRLAYIILCAEQYCKTKFTEKDFTPLFSKAWEVTNSMFDEWDYRFMEIIPEYLFEFDSYEESDFEYLSFDEYVIFADLLRDTDDALNRILLALHETVELYAYSDIPRYGKESVEIVAKVITELENAGITFPDPQCIAFSKFDENDGWGEPFDGKHLSIILNQN